MPAVGFALLALAVAPAADKVSLPGPRLDAGQELVYRGAVEEKADGPDGRFTKTWDLDVRVLVLEAHKGGWDCAVLTVLTPRHDVQIREAVKAVAGTPPPAGATPSVRLELVRVDDRGQVRGLAPEPTLPLTLDDATPTADPPVVPADGPWGCELGVFVPLPITAVAEGDTWDTAEPNRPPVVWAAKQAAVWNGRQVAEVTGVQQTDGFDTPAKVKHGWQRSEAVYVSPADGMASAFTRTVVRRVGAERVGSVKTTLELQPSNRHVGEKFRDTRGEVEAAWAFAAELEMLRGNRGKSDAVKAHRRRVVRYLDQKPTPTAFRPAVEAVLRRFEANAAPPVTPRASVQAAVEPPVVGKPAPDFAAADVDKPTGRVRLSGVRGKPAVVVFFKPGSETSEEALTVCEALFRKFGDGVSVVPLALGGDLIAASNQRAALKFGVPVFDGAEVAEKYAVRSYPRFYVIDADGGVRWAFESGVGPEVGSLVRKELEKLLK